MDKPRKDAGEHGIGKADEREEEEGDEREREGEVRGKAHTEVPEFLVGRGT
ncbi:hypothetical protein SLNWT_5995 [Streptomyces albus]|uniref:Uncharacterized protein n=1 Tax=Streptomyces albus (strain ATCC 21838 / DSM 41398 / FERM P-419 / JCM 4703 / NBRC 107858) TaxID=1081613 RepID=A0A0B5F663_STRA4|nr:hypothetical protein SLNWT_5995 [Streptomyces albus]AOU80674.1 hypothetical protein SLNHY_5983 [Streptomyces albus]AYN36383.1 hypothetical protein DUI70_5889 [Streptomyces albus]